MENEDSSTQRASDSKQLSEDKSCCLPKEWVRRESGAQPGCCCQYRWVTICLATFGMAIVNGMRVNVSVSVIMGREEAVAEGRNESNMTDVLPEITWPSVNIAFLHSVFYIGYLITQVPAGILAYRLPSNSIYGLGIVCSAILNLMLPFSIAMDAFWLVCILRLLQGLSEGFLWPASYAILHNWSTLSERNLLATVLAAGAVAGAIIGFPLAGLVVQASNWRYIFYGCGALGMIWYVVWKLVIYEKPDHHPNISDEELRSITLDKPDVSRQTVADLPWRSIAASLPFAAICACHLAKGWVYILLLTQVPAYMAEFDLSVLQSGLFSSLPFVARLIFSCSSGLVADAILQKKWLELTTVRKVLNTGGLAMESICFFALYFTYTGIPALAWLTVGFGLGGLATAGWQINHLDLAPHYAAILVGLSSIFGNAAGIVSPLIAGVIVQNSRYFAPENAGRGQLYDTAIYGWQVVFLISSVIVAVCCVFYLIASSAERQPWAEPAKMFLAMNGAPTIQYIDDLPQEDAARKPAKPGKFYDSYSYGGRRDPEEVERKYARRPRAASR